MAANINEHDEVQAIGSRLPRLLTESLADPPYTILDADKLHKNLNKTSRINNRSVNSELLKTQARVLIPSNNL
jgi:hypothetical protein